MVDFDKVHHLGVNCAWWNHNNTKNENGMLTNRDRKMSELPGNNQWLHFHHYLLILPISILASLDDLIVLRGHVLSLLHTI